MQYMHAKMHPYPRMRYGYQSCTPRFICLIRAHALFNRFDSIRFDSAHLRNFSFLKKRMGEKKCVTRTKLDRPLEFYAYWKSSPPTSYMGAPESTNESTDTIRLFSTLYYASSIANRSLEASSIANYPFNSRGVQRVFGTTDALASRTPIQASHYFTFALAVYLISCVMWCLH